MRHRSLLQLALLAPVPVLCSCVVLTADSFSTGITVDRPSATVSGERPKPSATRKPAEEPAEEEEAQRPATPAPMRSAAPARTPAPVADNKGMANKGVFGVMVAQPSLVIMKGKTTKLGATVRYVDGSTDGNVTLSTDDSTIVTVNGTNGEISGVRPGTATVRATAVTDSSKFALVTVTVKEGEVVDVLATVEPETARLARKGETVQLSAFLQTSAGKSSPNGSWKSSNSLVAIVDDEGLVTAVGNGTATITFTSDERSTVKATATVTVGEAASPATP